MSLFPKKVEYPFKAVLFLFFFFSFFLVLDSKSLPTFTMEKKLVKHFHKSYLGLKQHEGE